MDQSCLVVHKSRRPQARLHTAKLFCNNCDTDIMCSGRFFCILQQILCNELTHVASICMPVMCKVAVT
jgi:hypothetical protein